MDSRVLADAARFLAAVFNKNPAGRDVAAKLGLHDLAALDAFGLGFSNGTLARAVPSKGDMREALVGVGLLTPDGREAVEGCLVATCRDARGEVAGLVAVAPDGRETRCPATASLLGVNLAALRESCVVFTDSALKAFLLAQADVAGAAPIGAALSAEDRALLEGIRPAKAYLLGDNPELLRLLQKLEVPCHRLALDFPTTPEKVAAALKAAEPFESRVAPDATARVSEDRVLFVRGERRYELRELSPSEPDRLRVNLRVEAGGALHVDTLDLYASRSRAAFARAVAPVLAVPETAVAADLALMIRKLEAMRAQRRQEANAPRGYAMTPDEEAEALELVKSADLLGRIARDLDELGYVGETANKKLGYLIALSRKLDAPLCGVILSRAGAGKSRLMEVLSELVPPEELIAFTRITPQALYYADNRSLKHKLLVSGEDEGLIGSDYALRELISSKKIKLAAPLKDQATGKLKTVEYEVEGPISLLFSTTKPAIHFENATRCFLLSLDESDEQTARVHEVQRRMRTLEKIERDSRAAELRALHRNAQRLLKPLLVVNPFAPDLTFPTQPLEMRREHEKYLSLIDALALLRQYQRKRGKCVRAGREVEYVEADIADIEDANALMTEILGTRAEELSRPSRELLALVLKMAAEKARALGVEPDGYRFNRRDIREYTGWSDNQIKAHIRQLEDLEYLLVGKGERGRTYRYELAADGASADKKRLPGLTDTAAFRAKVGKLATVGDGGTGAAASSPVEKPAESLKVGRKRRKAYARRIKA
jgi:hypothetical protein